MATQHARRVWRGFLELKLAILYEYLYARMAKPGETRQHFLEHLDFRILRNGKKGLPETTKLNWRGYPQGDFGLIGR